MTKQPTMLDVIGREIQIGMPVAFCYSKLRCLRTGKISRFTKKKVGVSWTTISGHDYEHLVYPNDVTILPEDDYAWYSLKNG